MLIQAGGLIGAVGLLQQSRSYPEGVGVASLGGAGLQPVDGLVDAAVVLQ
jgi:hypothetical protein